MLNIATSVSTVPSTANFYRSPSISIVAPRPKAILYSYARNSVFAVPESAITAFRSQADLVEHCPLSHLNIHWQEYEDRWLKEYLWTINPPANEDAVCPVFQFILRRDMEALFGSANADLAPTHHQVFNQLHQVGLGNSLQSDIIPAIDAVSEADRENSMFTAQTTIHQCSAVISCRWTGNSASAICGAAITCENVPRHFRSTHGVERLNEEVPICCLWEGCSKWMLRKSFTRHIRERHAGHCRKQVIIQKPM